MIDEQISAANSCPQDKHENRKYVSINDRLALIVQRVENSRHNNKSKNYCKYQDKHENLLSFVILVEDHYCIVTNYDRRVCKDTQRKEIIPYNYPQSD